jgi:hypothetical protein
MLDFSCTSCLFDDFLDVVTLQYYHYFLFEEILVYSFLHRASSMVGDLCSL